MGFKIQRVNYKSAGTNFDFGDAFKMQKYLTNKTNDEVTIFDVGAFDGGTALRYKTLFPSSKIYSFEPFPESFSKLLKNTSSYNDIISINKGVGEQEGLATFNSNSFAATNSLLNTHQSGDKVWGSGFLDTLKTIEVELTSIDRFVESNGIQNIDILKMDVQGAEYKVIKGATETLKKGMIKVIYTEIITLPTYEEQLDFDEMIGLIKSFGFKLYNLYNLSLTKEGELRQVDALFIKSTPSNTK